MAQENQAPKIAKLLQTVIAHNASDLHIVSGQPPVMHVGGRIERLETESIAEDACVSMMKSITPERNQQDLSERGATDFGFALSVQARFHVAVLVHRGQIGIVLRRIDVAR